MPTRAYRCCVCGRLITGYPVPVLVFGYSGFAHHFRCSSVLKEVVDSGEVDSSAEALASAESLFHLRYHSKR